MKKVYHLSGKNLYKATYKLKYTGLDSPLPSVKHVIADSPSEVGKEIHSYGVKDLVIELLETDMSLVVLDQESI